MGSAPSSGGAKKATWKHLGVPASVLASYSSLQCLLPTRSKDQCPSIWKRPGLSLYKYLDSEQSARPKMLSRTPRRCAVPLNHRASYDLWYLHAAGCQRHQVAVPRVCRLHGKQRDQAEAGTCTFSYSI